MTDWPRPTWEPLDLHCRACKHEWQDWQPNGVAPSVWIAHIRALRCPSCGAGAKRLNLRFKHEDDPPAV